MFTFIRQTHWYWWYICCVYLQVINFHSTLFMWIYSNEARKPLLHYSCHFAQSCFVLVTWMHRMLCNCDMFWLAHKMNGLIAMVTCYGHCLWRLSPVILHCAVVGPHNVTLTHWGVDGEYCLVGTINRINQVLGLLVGSIESYYNPIPPPDDSGSRSTSGGASEGPGLVIKS